MSDVGVLSPSVDVLIADDDPVLRTGVRRLLERQGYRCTEAEEGHQTHRTLDSFVSFSRFRSFVFS